MLIVTETGNIIYSDCVIEIFKDKYRNGTNCVKASLTSGGDRLIVSGIDRESCELVIFAIVSATAEGRSVVNFYSKFEKMLREQQKDNED